MPVKNYPQLQCNSPKFYVKHKTLELNRWLKNETLKNVLEVGCHTGAQLYYLCMDGDRNGHGFDLSSKAIEAGKKQYPQLNLQVGRCPEFLNSYEDNSMDLIHFGFCFYLFSDGEFKESIEIALKKLKNNKFLSIEDFDSECSKSCSRDRVPIYKRDYSTIEGLKLLEKKVFYDDQGLNNVSYENESTRESLWLFKKT